MHVVGVCLARLLDAKSLGTLISERLCSRTCGGTVSSGRDIVFTRGVVTIYWLDGFANRTAQWSSDTHGISSDPNEQSACLGEIRNCCAVAVGRGSVAPCCSCR